MLKLLCYIFILLSPLMYSQSDSLSRITQKNELTVNELEFAKAEYIKMLKTEDYKRIRHMIGKIEIGANFNRVPMSSDAELTEWLKTNLKSTNFKTVEEGLACIRPYVNLYNKLIQEYIHVYELMGRASLEQVGEILEPEFHLTQEDLKLKE